tara:strand:- start:3017 stop:3772 length:756 start_codon:yes stop_codon:yes gene_type:complete
MNLLETISNEELLESQKLTPEMVLILDTETTGLDPTNGFCLEVGAIFFNIPSRSVLSQISFLIPVQSNDAEKINKIPAEITRLRQPWQEGLAYFNSLLDSSEVLIAHNAAFDRQWFGNGILPEINKKWICTMEDISWPSEKQLSSIPSVRDLALAYGVPVWNAHRALTDCIYLAEVFKRCENLESLLSIALEPRRLFRAQVSYDERHLAKKAGFRWNSPVQGAWTRRLSEREILNLDFSVVPVDNNFKFEA